GPGSHGHACRHPGPAQRRARPADDGGRGLSGAEGQPEHDAAHRGADQHREPGGLRAPGLQRFGHGLQQQARGVSLQRHRRHVQLRGRGAAGHPGRPRRGAAAADGAVLNFFERQEQARRNTTRLVVLFALAVAGIVIAACLAMALFVGPDPGALVGTAVITGGIIGLASLYRISSLGSGGAAVAMQVGGVPVPEDTADPQLRRLRNVVEEMSIASGVPVPAVFVLEQESGINAFAAGYSTSDAAVAVTRGALDKLNRDELQGVVAHEYSHILNGDMRLNIRLMGVLFGILVLGLMGRKILMFGGRSRDRNAGALLIVALVAVVIGAIGMFFGRMIKAGVSRSREVLADASAVQFTRQTRGIAGALKKIAGVEEGSRFEQRAEAEEVSHMLFGDGLGLSGLFATHPPILKRIQALEPGFRSEQLERLQQQWRAAPPNGLQEDLSMGLAADGVSRLPDARAEFSVTPPMVSAQVANPRDDDYRHADTIAATLPAELAALARKREAVKPLLLGLLLDDADASVRGHQHSESTARLGAEVTARSEDPST